MQLTQTIANRFSVALVALGLMVLGFGHQHAPATADDRMLAAYVQMGGALDDLCITGQDGPQAGTSLRIATLALPRASHLLANAHAPRGPLVRGPTTSFV
ncbi:hypothetical protein [Roseinatronobacter sp. S2]|uniref:hypothetical protein n=1 Tax=Roseinatronobacter sp. S2 TaxID=3035471 RepID=UPI0024100984|nr:hypothetical protein [Roseinatronobacter sp. S2]WFE75775.1 hypothetical protein P8S53_05040 [Roseinatronobacter sp. S2]